MRERFDRSDSRFFVICALLFAICLAIGLRYFDRAFPEASINFRYDRQSSEKVAAAFLTSQKIRFDGMKHAATFDHDSTAKVFLERSVGLERANELMGDAIEIWSWEHRWFRPLEKREIRIGISPSGELVSFEERLAEDAATKVSSLDTDRLTAVDFLEKAGFQPASLNLLSESDKTLPNRVDRVFEWESRSVRPANAPYRYRVVASGGKVRAFVQSLRVPDEWKRGYRRLRSKNQATGLVDTVLLIITMAAALLVFVFRARRGDLKIQFSLTTAIIGAVLVAGVALNSFPSALAGYPTNTSYPAFVAEQIVFAIFEGLALGVVLMVVAGSGEALHREHYPDHLSTTRLFSRQAVESKRVFKGLVLGYTLFAAFLAYQVIFYLVASKLGAWSPAEVPYDEILNTRFPWIAVLFMGFFPAVSEEFLSRAFSIPWLHRIFKSRLVAIVVAGLIWGFGHAGYPNQPFYIRGLEVGIAGIVIGLLFVRFGLFPLLVWHYTVDALYTSVLLFKSNNVYYIVSGALASLIFVLPCVVSLVLYVRNKGFLPDDSLSNGAIGTKPEAEVTDLPVPETADEIVPYVAPRRVALVALAVAAPLALVSIWLAGPSASDIVDYRITKSETLKIASDHLALIGERNIPASQIVIPVEGMRSWNDHCSREDGGCPEQNSPVILGSILGATRSVPKFLEIARSKVEAATWMARYFTPLEKSEIFVEVDPRRSRVVGFHRYLDEEQRGASLDRSQAERLAKPELGRYSLIADDFELKEALSFQQSNRRDWLFHYEEKTPLSGRTVRRVSIRVAGDRVSQFAKTARVPEEEERSATRWTIANTTLGVLRTAGFLGILFLVTWGCVLAGRERKYRWQRPLRLALILTVAPLLATVLGWNGIAASYGTSIPWETFLVMSLVRMLASVGFQAAVLFASLFVIETAFPAALGSLRTPARLARGRASAVAAIAAIATIAVVDVLLDSIAIRFPHLFPISISVSPLIDSLMPLLSVVSRAVFVSIVASAIAAGVASAITAAAPRQRRWLELAAIVALIFGMLDIGVPGGQMSGMLFRVVIAGATVWFVARLILAREMLAWPLAAGLITLIDGAAALLGNHRSDLQAQAVILLGLAALLTLSLLRRGSAIELPGAGAG